MFLYSLFILKFNFRSVSSIILFFTFLSRKFLVLSVVKKIKKSVYFFFEYIKLLSFTLCILFLTSCSSNKSSSLKSFYRKLSRDDPKNLTYKGSYKIGDKYKIKGSAYKPKKYLSYNKVGIASWYGGRKFHGRATANGDVFNKRTLTAAHRTLPLPSLVKVTNLKNNKSVILLVNDRGPFNKNREIDVSEKAALILGMKHLGTAKVRVEYLHSETRKFLNDIGLAEEHKARSKKKLGHCSVNCHVKIVNMKHKCKIN